MTDRPILMSAPMVRACLDGSKTQTRRAIKKQPDAALVSAARLVDKVWCWLSGHDGSIAAKILGHGRCPYGQPGDRLWVRETWAYNPDFGHNIHFICYRADPGCEYDVPKWRPSIHMPRGACRIELEVAGVRVERLQEISEADAIAEGIEPIKSYPGRWKNYLAPSMWDVPLLMSACTEPWLSYGSLWDSINGAGAWDANPWVWVVEFKRVKP